MLKAGPFINVEGVRVPKAETLIIFEGPEMPKAETFITFEGLSDAKTYNVQHLRDPGDTKS